MAKYSGSYERIVLGVSQQVPQDRREGQHFEQINMISDPVRGLVRRQGSVFINDSVAPVINPQNMGANESSKYRSYDFVVGNDRYTLIYRVDPQPEGQNYRSQFCYCWDKERNRFLNVVYTDGGDTNEPGVPGPGPNLPDSLVAKLRTNGAASLTNVGRYLYIAVKGHSPEYTTNDLWGSAQNRSLAVFWIRNGGYSKKFKVTLKVKPVAGGPTVELLGEYTTLSASYPGILDTTDIPFSDPEYQKKINDRTNEYNSQVTQWIGIAAADIDPVNIATKLMESLEDARDAASITPSELTFEMSNSSVGIKGTDYLIEELSVSDSGDETFIRGAANIVSNVDKLTAEHYPGKIVKIQPKREDASDSYYVKALPRVPNPAENGLTEVSWVQAAGTEVKIGSTFVFATVEGDTLYLSGHAEALRLTAGLGEPVPDFDLSSVGDLITSPVPYFLGRKIDFLGNFQDRLIIGSGSTLLFSRPGRYLNFFRQDTLSVLDDDPIEIYPTGSEDDTIRASVMFQKAMILFGDRKQYVLSGSQALTPKNAIMPIVGAHEDAVDAHPVASGNFIFHTKWRNGITSLHQLQGGYVADTPESHEISKQISSYMKGKPLEMLPITTPDTILIRTDKDPTELFVYNYLDTQDATQRVFDSWSKWKWNEQLGYACGMTYDRGDIIVFSFRKRRNADQSQGDDTVHWSIVADKFSLSGEMSDKPYLDSLMKLETVETPSSNTQWHNLNSELSDRYVAFDNTVRERFLGQTWETRQALLDGYPTKVNALWTGIGFDAFVTPTNPYIRDSKAKAIVNGRTVINQFIVSMADTAGVRFEVNPKGGQTVLKGDFNGRQLSRPTAEIGIQPVADEASVPFIVGMENTMFTYTIRSRDWLPLTVVAITWVGQLFSNTRRA